MSGWEPSDWNSGGGGGESQSAVDFVPDGDGFLKNCETSPIFSVDVLERSASKGHGLVTSVAAGNNVLLVGTNKGWIVRHDFLSSDVLELDLSARGIEQWIPKVFIDPGGRHSIFTVCSNGAADTYYLHGKWRKPRMLSSLYSRSDSGDHIWATIRDCGGGEG